MRINKKKKLPLLLLVMSFILPIIVAKIYLSFDLYNGGVTNKGELITQSVNYQDLNLANPFPQKWQILYLLPQQCDAACQYRLHILQQSHTALGKYQDRVKVIIAKSHNSDSQTQLTMNVIKIDNNMTNNINEHLYIIDPLGNFVMRYPLTNDEASQLTQGKDLLTDLRKMLKLSRIG